MKRILVNYGERVCAYHGCGKTFTPRTKVHRFCSNACFVRKRTGYPTTRDCRWCGTSFQVLTQADANRWHCSKKCAKTSSSKKVRSWNEDHPEMRAVYTNNRLAKNPNTWRDESRRKRQQVLDMLGHACIVCGVTNPHWLHLDYIPTSIGKKYRHSRGPKFVRDHIEDFRLLCANHHYELTMTGKIEGTDIRQVRWAGKGPVEPDD